MKQEEKRRYTSIKRKLSTGRKKTKASTLPLFLRLPASIKYACCEEKEVIFILFSQTSPRKQAAQNCFPQLLEEIEAVFLKSNQHLSIKTVRKGSVFSNCKGQSINQRNPSSL